MSKSFPTGWLVGAVVVLTLLGFAAFLIPFRPCGTCGGFVVATRATLTPDQCEKFPPRLDCPDCGDNAKVSFYKACRPFVTDAVARILRGLPDRSRKESTEALEFLLQRKGMNSRELFSGNGPLWTRVASARFLRAGDRTFLVLLTEQHLHMVPGRSRAGVFLLEPHGEVLDYIQGSCSTKDGSMGARFLDGPAEDGAQMKIYGLYFGESEYPVEIQPWRRDTRHGTTLRDGKGWRIRIQGERLELPLD